MLGEKEKDKMKKAKVRANKSSEEFKKFLEKDFE